MNKVSQSALRGDSRKHRPRTIQRTFSLSRAARVNFATRPCGYRPPNVASSFSCWLSSSSVHHAVLGSTSLAFRGPSVTEPATDEAWRDKLGAWCGFGTHSGRQCTAAAANSASTLRNANRGRTDAPTARDKVTAAFKLIASQKCLRARQVLRVYAHFQGCAGAEVWPKVCSAELHVERR